MAFKKIEKEFVLSDSSINKYGMRLLTSGYQLPEFLKSPVGYYMHKYGEGVLLRWEDVRLDGDKVVGKPVINMSHERGQKTVDEIEDGFLNAASVGKLVMLEYHLDDNPDDPENPIIVVDKWYNKECSLVDIPGNRSAFKVGAQEQAVLLYDADDNEVSFDRLRMTMETKQSSNMKKITLEITPELKGFLGLSDGDVTAEAVIDSIKQLHTENGTLTTAKTTAETALKTERANNAKDKIKSILDNGLSDGKINAATAKRLETEFEGRPKELGDLISDMPKYQSLTDRLVDGELPKELADKSYDEIHKLGKVGELKEKFPAKYKELYKAKFGVEPK